MARDLTASVRQRLKNKADQEARPFNQVLQHYGLERWLYRLSRSTYADQLILKGAMLLLAEDLPLSRPTQDIDFLASLSNDLEAVRAAVASISSTPVEDDGLTFEADSTKTERISEAARYEGVRATVRGQLGTARLTVKIDLGFSDVVTPGPRELVCPTLLDFPAPRVLAYSLESAIAEKLESMVSLGEINTRMKDFFDVWALAETHGFDEARLRAAVQQTFSRRGTEPSAGEAFLAGEFPERPAVSQEWTRFLARTGLGEHAPADFQAVWEAIGVFLMPILEGGPEDRAWIPVHGWSAREA